MSTTEPTGARAVDIELHLDLHGDELEGSARTEGRAPRHFTGWVGLIGALDALTEGAPTGAPHDATSPRRSPSVLPGDLSVNPVSGERVRWLVTSAQSGGALARFELWCASGGGVPARHVHPYSAERFEVFAGRVELEVGDARRVAGPGEVVLVPAGVAHRWKVVSDEEAHLLVELDAPHGADEQLETIFAAARRGLLAPGGRAPLLLTACACKAYFDAGRPAGVPVAVQRALFAGLVLMARGTGAQRRFEQCRAEARARLARIARADVAPVELPA